MSEQSIERRRLDHTALLDNAIRSANQLYSSKDSATRIAANRVIADLQKLRAEMPKRRQDDQGKVE